MVVRCVTQQLRHGVFFPCFHSPEPHRYRNIVTGLHVTYIASFFPIQLQHRWNITIMTAQAQAPQLLDDVPSWSSLPDTDESIASDDSVFDTDNEDSDSKPKEAMITTKSSNLLRKV